MMHYYFEVEKRPSESHVYIVNEVNNKIGEVFLEKRSGFDRENCFKFLFVDGGTYFLGLRIRRFKDMNVARYELYTSNEIFKFREKKIHNLMNFRVDGIIDDENYSFTERVAGVLEIIKNGTTIGRITEDEIVLNDNTLAIEQSALIMMYFMYKLYKRENVNLKKYLYEL